MCNKHRTVYPAGPGQVMINPVQGEQQCTRKCPHVHMYTHTVMLLYYMYMYIHIVYCIVYTTLHACTAWTVSVYIVHVLVRTNMSLSWLVFHL